MTVIVNLIGGPGCAKSTVAAGVFERLKKSGHSAELVTEYVKDIVYDNNQMELQDQFLITAQQNHRLLRLKDKVDFVICDASLLNGIVYDKYHNCSNDNFHNYIIELYKSYNNTVFMLPRPDSYSPQGRMQTISEAIQIDNLFSTFLHSEWIEFTDLRKTKPNDVSDIIYNTLIG